MPKANRQLVLISVLAFVMLGMTPVLAKDSKNKKSRYSPGTLPKLHESASRIPSSSPSLNPRTHHARDGVYEGAGP